MYYTFREIDDGYGHKVSIRFGRATRTLHKALDALKRIKDGEVRDDHNIAMAVASEGRITTLEGVGA